MRYLLFLLLAGIHTSLSIFGQSESKAEVYGKVREYNDDGFGKQLLPTRGATIQLAAGKDTLYTTTNYDGIFLFKNIKPQIIQLKIFLLGKKTIEGEYVLEPGRNAFYFTMEEASEQLESAKVSANGLLSHQLADTTIYNVKLLNSLEGESARALLEQLPGFKMNNDRITIDGEEVKRTYVNGVLIFGDHPVTAVDALKAEEVVQVNVYDELSPEDGHRGSVHGKKQRVLDIKTQEKIVSLTDAVILAEGGTDEYGQGRYQGMGAVAFWSEETSLSAIVDADNLSVSLQDVDRFSHLPPLELAKMAQVLSRPLNTYSESISAKIGFAKYWKDRQYGNSLQGSYSYGRNHLKSAESALTQYYQITDSPAISYYDTTSAANVANRHLFDISANLHDTPLKSISLSVYGNVDNQTGSTLEIEQIVSDDIKLRRESTSDKRNNYDITVRAGWTDNDHQKIKPAFDVSAQFTKEQLTSWIVDTMATSYTRRKLSTEGNGNGVSVNATASLSYVLLNNESHSLSINGKYRFNYLDVVKRQMAVDSLDVVNPAISIGNTFDYTWRNLNHIITLGGSYYTQKLQLDGGLILAGTSILGEDRYPVEAPIDKHYFSALPFLGVKFRNLTLTITTDSDLPAQEQIRNYISDANPMVLSAGNPFLEKSYKLGGKIQWTRPLKKNNGRIMLSLKGDSSFKPIVAKSHYFSQETQLPEYSGYKAPAGSILYTFANSPSPAWNVEATTSYSGVFFKRKLVSTVIVSGLLKETPQFVGEEIIGLDDMLLTASANLRFTPNKKIKVSFLPTASFLKSTNAVGQTITENIGVSVPLTMNYNFLSHGFINVNNRFGYNHYLSGFGKDITTDFLSAVVGWRFLRNSLVVSVSANDLFNASTKYVTETTAQYFRQTWIPNYGRYYLLSITYEFRKKQ